MYFAVIDGGTTNTSVYIVNQDLSIIAKDSVKVGVKDTAINDSRDVLRKSLQSLLKKTTRSLGMPVDELKFAIAFGMITSELGLIEIPHISAPVTISELISQAERIHDEAVFPADIPVIFVRGIKNGPITCEGYGKLRGLDFIRGEETQLIGLLERYTDLVFPITFVFLSSHTKYISVDSEQRVLGSLTTLSGQLYEALSTSTSISKSIARVPGEQPNGSFNSDIVDTAFDCVNKAGFLRALLMPRFMDVLLDTSVNDRCLFVEAVIVSEDLKVLNEFETLGFPSDTEFVLVGHENRCAVFEHLLRKRRGINCIRKISSFKEQELISVAGAIRIAKDMGCLTE